MYICRHFPRECTIEMDVVCRVYDAVGNGCICTNGILVEYVLDSSTRGIKTYLSLKYCWCLTCFVTGITRPCDLGREESFGSWTPGSGSKLLSGLAPTSSCRRTWFDLIDFVCLACSIGYCLVLAPLLWGLLPPIWLSPSKDIQCYALHGGDI